MWLGEEISCFDSDNKSGKTLFFEFSSFNKIMNICIGWWTPPPPFSSIWWIPKIHYYTKLMNVLYRKSSHFTSHYNSLDFMGQTTHYHFDYPWLMISLFFIDQLISQSCFFISFFSKNVLVFRSLVLVEVRIHCSQES